MGRNGWMCACIAAHGLAQAEGDATATLPQVEVVAPTVLPGLGIARDRLPYTVERIDGKAITGENAVSLPELMGQRLPSVNLNEIQGNPFHVPVAPTPPDAVGAAIHAVLLARSMSAAADVPDADVDAEADEGRTGS